METPRRKAGRWPGFGLRMLGAVLWAAMWLPVQAGETVVQTDSTVRQLTLDEAVTLALAQNPDIRTALQEIERTRGLFIEVRAQALPQISLTGGYNQQDPNLLESPGGFGSSGSSQADASPSPTPEPPPQDSGGEGGGGGTVPMADEISAPPEETPETDNSMSGFGFRNDKSWQISLQARQALYAGGQLGSALKIARYRQDTSYFQLLETVNTVIADVRKAFYQILLNRALIGVQQQSVELLRQQLDEQNSRFEVGTVPRFNVLRAEVELANVQPDLIRAENAYLVSRLQLARLLGIPSNAGLDEVRPPVDAVGRLDTSRRPLPLSQALALARVQRPFLKVQRKAILIEAESITQTLTAYKPRLYATGGYTVRNSSLSDDLAETVNGWFFGIEGNWAIFDGFATYGKTKQAKARLESAKIGYDDSVLQVELEVQDALTRLQAARALVLSQTKNQEQALEALRLSRERLDVGAGTQLEVLDARVALTRAQATEVQARYDYNVALADFEKATGGATQYDAGFEDPLTRRKKPKR